MRIRCRNVFLPAPALKPMFGSFFSISWKAWAIARPNFSAISDVIGSRLAMPRIPSVPNKRRWTVVFFFGFEIFKFLLLFASSASPEGGLPLLRLARSRSTARFPELSTRVSLAAVRGQHCIHDSYRSHSLLHIMDPDNLRAA